MVATNEVYGGADSGGGDVGFGGLLAAARVDRPRVRGEVQRRRAAAVLPRLAGQARRHHPERAAADRARPRPGAGRRWAGEQKVVVSVTGSTLHQRLRGRRRRQHSGRSSRTRGGRGLAQPVRVRRGRRPGRQRPGGAGVVKYQLDLGQAANLLLVGQNVPYSHRIGAYDAGHRRAAGRLPGDHRRLPVPVSSTVANVAGGRVEPGARRHRPRAAARLRRRSPARTRRLPQGHRRLAVRAGRASATTAAWPRSRARASCSSGTPTTPRRARANGPPSATTSRARATTTPTARRRARPTRCRSTPLGGTVYRLKFRSPGDDGLCGTADRYVADVDGAAARPGRARGRR